jgi:predicted PhzF superfamily epimerase YddE/YHI9
MDFPTARTEPAVCPEALARGLGRDPVAVFRSSDWLAVLSSEADVRALRPDLAALRELDLRAVIVTAPAAAATGADFVCRVFAPRVGIPEDPVTGSAFCTLTPYWSRRLDRAELLAVQCSERGGVVRCVERGDRILILGQAVCYLRGEISLRRGDSGRCKMD